MSNGSLQIVARNTFGNVFGKRGSPSPYAQSHTMMWSGHEKQTEGVRISVAEF